MNVFTMALKRVQKYRKTCAYFTGLKEENYFYNKKIFTSRKEEVTVLCCEFLCFLIKW